MSLEKQTVIDLIEVTEYGVVQVRTNTRIIEDGKVLSSSFHRNVFAPGDDYSGENVRVKAICKAAHTASVIAAYKATATVQGV